jgi:hypothetical protein
VLLQFANRRMKKTKRKTAVKSAVKTGERGRNAGRGQVLSSGPPAKKAMRTQIQRATRKKTETAPKQGVRESIDRVIAECDRVDAALIEITRAAQNDGDDMPPLAIRMVELGRDAGATSGWAVVSGDPSRPLTEQQARDIVAAMKSIETNAPFGVAAE